MLAGIVLIARWAVDDRIVVLAIETGAAGSKAVPKVMQGVEQVRRDVGTTTAFLEFHVVISLCDVCDGRSGGFADGALFALFLQDPLALDVEALDLAFDQFRHDHDLVVEVAMAVDPFGRDEVGVVLPKNLHDLDAGVVREFGELDSSDA